jgi:hypothetical protein
MAQSTQSISIVQTDQQYIEEIIVGLAVCSLWRFYGATCVCLSHSATGVDIMGTNLQIFVNLGVYTKPSRHVCLRVQDGASCTTQETRNIQKFRPNIWREGMTWIRGCRLEDNTIVGPKNMEVVD